MRGRAGKTGGVGSEVFNEAGVGVGDLVGNRADVGVGAVGGVGLNVGAQLGFDNFVGNEAGLALGIGAFIFILE